MSKQHVNPLLDRDTTEYGHFESFILNAHSPHRDFRING